MRTVGDNHKSFSDRLREIGSLHEAEIQDKELILRVLSMYSDPAVREKEIKNIAQAFEEIKEDVLPALRRSQLMIDVDNIGYTDEEIAGFAKDNPDTLNLEEILYAATLTDDKAEKLRIYKVAATNHADIPNIINGSYAIRMIGGRNFINS